MGVLLGLALSLAHCSDDGPTGPAGPFQLTVLQDFRGLTRSYAYDVNSAGHVVGMAERVTPRESFNAALWTTQGKPISLEAEGIVMQVAYGINAGGQVVGMGGCGEMGTACLWEAGQLRSPGFVDYDGWSEPRAINNHGDAVGWSEVWPSGAQHAVLWRDGIATDLGTLGGHQSEALDINNKGQVVGWARPVLPDGSILLTRHAFLWQDGTMIDLGPPGDEEGIAFAINDSGQVVGWVSDPVVGRRAFLWEKGTMTLLAGSETSQAFDVNNRGDVVGTYIVSGTTHHAALWRDGVRYDLNHKIALQGLDLCLDWANAINDAGQIVGMGAWKHDAREFGFLLTPTGIW